MPEVKEEVLEEIAKTDPPQKEIPAKTEGEKPTSEKLEEKIEKKESEASESTVTGLKGFEKLTDGRIKLTIGGSAYFGKDADEALANAEKGIQEKNKSYQTTQEELRKLKAKSSIREPEEVEDEAQLPPEPKAEEFIRASFKERDLDVKMVNWTDAQWDEYQEKEGLKDRHIVKMQSDIAAAKTEAERRFYGEQTKWINLAVLRKEITPTVQEMVVDAGLDPEEFGEAYIKILKDPAMRYKNGELNQAAILRAMHKKVVEAMKAQGVSTSEVEKQKTRLHEELEEKKKSLQSGASRTDKKPLPQGKVPANLKEAFSAERWRSIVESL